MNLLLLDLDDTLFVANGIFIYRKLSTDKKEVPLTPAEFSKSNYSDKTKNFYDFRDFGSPDKIYSSIKNSSPIVRNLQIMDKYICKGWEIGILTARGMEDTVYRAVSAWLLHKNKGGKFEPINLKRELVFAVGEKEPRHLHRGPTSFDRKASIIRELCKKYKEVKFMDDDQRNIDAVMEVSKKENLNVSTIKV
jgi:hypothetical protein